ncbi:MAG: hypothetical protein AAFY71_17655 [Bacteroidota bacterium]
MKSFFRFSTLAGLIALIFLSSCGSTDLSLINQVKRFEPEWMSLSEKVTFMDRYLRVTSRRYVEDLQEVDPLISPSNSEAYGLKNQYKTMMDEQTAIATDFDARKAEFAKAVAEFNEWQNKLMKNKLATEEAAQEFINWQKKEENLATGIDKLQNDLIKNIEKHNSLMRRIARSLKIYTNYDIRYE